MSEPQSPFDEPDDTVQSGEPAHDEQKPLERKWSFVGLGIVLFLLVWIREFTGMSPDATIASAILILVGWSMFHVSMFTKLPHTALRMLEESNVQSTAAEQSADETVRPLPKRTRGGAVRLAGAVGVILGIWMQAFFWVNPIVLSVLVLVIYLFALFVERLVRRLP